MTMVLTLDPYHDAENPSESDGWTVYSFSDKHCGFKDPESLGLSSEFRDGYPVVRNPGLRKKLEVGLAYWLSYYEHGDCCWFRAGARSFPDMQWDGTRVAGLVVWELSPDELGAKTLSARAQDVDQFLQNYTHWCNGWCYIATLCADETEDSELLEIVTDYGGEYLEQSVAEMLRRYQPATLIVMGEYADMAADWDLPLPPPDDDEVESTHQMVTARLMDLIPPIPEFVLPAPPALPEPRRDIVRKKRK